MLSAMAVALHFQGPDERDPTLLELLADAASSSDRGVAIFSFASRGGVRLLFSDPDFSGFLSRAKFQLIVGVDAVTTPDVLTMLADEATSHAGLQARVFLHSRKAALFHPKVCWFCNAQAGRAVVGSGNLTRGGLLNNWEAFLDAKTKAKGTRRITSRWDRWLAANQTNLYLPTDPHAIARAQDNQSARTRHEEAAVETEDDHAEANGNDLVLVAEIPRAADRWNQANFDLETYTRFFGLSPGTTRRVVLYPVREDGTVGDPEVRPGVSVKSQNYRVELGQAAGPYPPSGRPLGIFRRTGVRRFRYRVLMPQDDGYDDASLILAREQPDLDNQRVRMKRIVLPYAEFRKIAETPAI